MLFLKKFVIILSMFLVTGNAHAIKKCIVKPGSGACGSSVESGGDGNSQWATNCFGNGWLGTVKGSFICSSTPGTQTGQVADNVEMSSNNSENTYCWCIMTSPAASKYVFSHNAGGNYAYCSYYCATNCYQNFSQNSTFRNAMYDNLISGE